MPTVMRIRRTSVEVSGELAKAEEMLEMASEGEYLHTKCSAIRDVCLWLLERRVTAPVTGAELRPDDDAVMAEMERGEALEAQRRRTGGDAVTPGAAAHLLAYVMCDPDTEAPL